MTLGTRFQIVVDAPALRDAVAPAIQAASDARKLGENHMGAVFAQLYILDDGRVEIRGDFIEHKYAASILAALTLRHQERNGFAPRQGSERNS